MSHFALPSKYPSRVTMFHMMILRMFGVSPSFGLSRRATVRTQLVRVALAAERPTSEEQHSLQGTALSAELVGVVAGRGEEGGSGSGHRGVEVGLGQVDDGADLDRGHALLAEVPGSDLDRLVQ